MDVNAISFILGETHIDINDRDFTLYRYMKPLFGVGFGNALR